jgi:hypothetical protein
MPSAKRLDTAEQQTLTLACEAFAEATRHYRAMPTSAPARGKQSASRARASDREDGADAWIRFTIAGRHVDLPVVIKAAAGASGAGTIVNRMHARAASQSGRPLMLVTRHVTPRLADELIAKGIPFLDTAGNVYFQQPEATIMIVGRGKPALGRLDRTSRSTTPKGLRITFALLTQAGLVHAPYRAIAAQTAVALNTVNLAMDDLMNRRLVVLKGKRRIIADRRRLIEDWVSLYPVRLRPKLGARRFSSFASDQNWWRGDALPALGARLGGDTAADILTHALKPTTLTLYSHAGVTPGLMAKGMLRPDERGNVEVIEAFWPAQAEPGWHLSHREVVHPLLVYTDLITSDDDRHRGVAQTIYDRYLASEQP